MCIKKRVCVCNKPWTCVRQQQTLFAAGFTCPQALRIANQSTFLHRTQCEPCVLLWPPVYRAQVCAERDRCEGGYSSLSLRTKSLYICTYVVLKSYTFGLSGAGPGSFTWDPVPNERTSKPRLLQRKKKQKQNNTGVSLKSMTDNMNMKFYELQTDWQSYKSISESLWAASQLTGKKISDLVWNKSPTKNVEKKI